MIILWVFGYAFISWYINYCYRRFCLLRFCAIYDFILTRGCLGIVIGIWLSRFDDCSFIVSNILSICLSICCTKKCETFSCIFSIAFSMYLFGGLGRWKFLLLSCWEYESFAGLGRSSHFCCKILFVRSSSFTLVSSLETYVWSHILSFSISSFSFSWILSSSSLFRSFCSLSFKSFDLISFVRFSELILGKSSWTILVIFSVVYSGVTCLSGFRISQTWYPGVLVILSGHECVHLSKVSSSFSNSSMIETCVGSFGRSVSILQFGQMCSCLS